MSRNPAPALLALALAATVGACVGGPAETPGTLHIDGKADSSVVATFLSFELDGELYLDWAHSPEQDIESQLLYTVGQLNGDNSVSRTDRVEITDVQTEELDEGGFKVTYRAVVPVAWGRQSDIPETYTFRLPRRGGYQALEEFTSRYDHTCVDYGAHDVTSGVMWYYYRPERPNCGLDPDDVVDVVATVSESDIGTTGRYPEYHEVWRDEELRVLAIFGKFEDDATSGDAGINAYNSFVGNLSSTLRQAGAEVVTTPEEMPSRPGVDLPDVTFDATLPDGRTVHVDVMLIPGVQTADATFNSRYEELSGSADLIAYNGHSGLGANIRALARKGRWVEGQYAIVYMNGCDTYAYVDSALWDAHAAVNSDDPTGTRTLDIISNAMPVGFSTMSSSTLAIVESLISYDEPRTYERILGEFSSRQVALVSGEEDNVYVPGYDPDGGGSNPAPEPWEGLEGSGTLASNEEARFETPELPAGRYVFEMTGTGDADLYVRIGSAPDTNTYDCRPYAGSSNETCVADVPTPAVVHAMVRGYRDGSTFQLTARPE